MDTRRGVAAVTLGIDYAVPSPIADHRYPNHNHDGGEEEEKVLTINGLGAIAAGETLARSHHGSLAREQRTDIEDRLKAGTLPALIARYLAGAAGVPS